MITFKKYFAYILATLLMGGIIIFIPSIADSIAPTYILLVGSFLAIDLGYTLRETNKLPEGDFKPIKQGRYIFTTLLSGALFILALIVSKKSGLSLTGTTSVLGISMMTILSLYIGGLEGSKFLTGKKPESLYNGEKNE